MIQLLTVLLSAWLSGLQNDSPPATTRLHCYNVDSSQLTEQLRISCRTFDVPFSS